MSQKPITRSALVLLFAANASVSAQESLVTERTTPTMVSEKAVHETVDNNRSATPSAAPANVWDATPSPFDPMPAPQRAKSAPSYAAPPPPVYAYEMMPIPQTRPTLRTPNEYWDCLLQNLQGIGSDVAAKLVERACQEKFPKRPAQPLVQSPAMQPSTMQPPAIQPPVWMER